MKQKAIRVDARLCDAAAERLSQISEIKHFTMI